MARVTQMEVYNLLSEEIYKTGLEIRNELRGIKGIDDPGELLQEGRIIRFPREAVRDINTIYIHFHLSDLIDEGYVEQRKRETVISGGSLTQSEYKRIAGKSKIYDLEIKDEIPNAI
jgi:hypothetical protein